MFSFPTRPLGSSGNWKGGSGNWTNATDLPNWISSLYPDFKNSWRDTEAVFPGGSGAISVGEVSAQGISIFAPYTFTGGTINLPSTAEIVCYGTSSILCGITGGSDMTISGTGGTLTLLPSAVTGRSVLTVEKHIVINSASNVDLTDNLYGDGTIEISGGGHILVGGIDAGARSFDNPPGFTGTIITPTLNSAPILADPLPELFVSYGSTTVFTPSFTDADGDSLTWHIVSGSATGGANVTYAAGAFVGQASITLYGDDGYGGTTDNGEQLITVLPSMNFTVGSGSPTSHTVSGTYKVLFPSNTIWDSGHTVTGSGTLEIYNTDTSSGWEPMSLQANMNSFTGTMVFKRANNVRSDFVLGDKAKVNVGGGVTLNSNSGKFGNGCTLRFEKVTDVSIMNMDTASRSMTFNTTASTGGGYDVGGNLIFSGGDFPPTANSYSVTGTLNHDGGIYANNNTTVTFSAVPNGPVLKPNSPALSGPPEWHTPAGKFVLPSSPSMTNLKMQIPFEVTGGSFDNVVVSWSGTATGMPSIRGLDGVPISPTFSLGSYYYHDADTDTTAVFTASSGIRIVR